MNTTISNNGLPALPPATTATSSSGDKASAASTASSSQVKTADSISLTDSARALQQASDTTTQSPVDTARVDQIRHSLASGTYQINAGKIADRLASLETQIAGKP